MNALELTLPAAFFIDNAAAAAAAQQTATAQTATTGPTTTAAAEKAATTVAGLPQKVLNELTEVVQPVNRDFVQLSGHPGSLAIAGPDTLWKKITG